MVSYWRGRRLEELTREELIEAVKILGRQLKEQERYVSLGVKRSILEPA